jgi:hypothetical protein
MYKARWKWFSGLMMAAALVACGDDSPSQPDAAVPDARPPEAPDAQPPDVPVADAGVADAQPGDGGAADAGPGVCPMAEALWEDIDIAAFTQLSDLGWLDVADVMLARETTYWELRRSVPGGGEGFDVLLHSGEKCVDAANPEACRVEFDALVAETGFGPSCLPGQCIQYIAVNRGNTNQLILTREELVVFLGNVDTPVEAALLAHAHGYTWDATMPDAGSVRAVEDGYELLVTELTQFCDPVVTDRVLLHVGIEGTAQPMRRQVYSSLCNACI